MNPSNGDWWATCFSDPFAWGDTSAVNVNSPSTGASHDEPDFHNSSAAAPLDPPETMKISKQDSPTIDSSMTTDMEQQQLQHEFEMLEPPPPVRLRYDLSLTVQDFKTKEPKCLVHNAAGKADPGDLVALCGPSGSGKTSLLTVLAGRMAGYDGTVLLNDKPPASTARGELCFIEQQDLFIPSITPREHLLFTASLRMEHSSEQDIIRTVQGLLQELGLEKCADTPIGAPESRVKGRISGGEKKRLSLATELLGRPSVIFADEVTTGLDSHMAETVVMKLKQLAESGHTVLVSIHQPSSYVFSAFSHVHLLSQGRTAFSGSCDEAVDYFGSIGHPLPALTNPCDFYLKLLSMYPENEAILDAWEETPRTEELRLEQSVEAKGRFKVFFQRSDYAANWFTQLIELMGRTVLAYRRDPTLGRLRLAQSIFVGVLVGVIYLMIGQSPISRDNIQSVNGALFYGVFNQGLLGSLGVVQVFPLEKPVFRRECSADTYSVSAYVTAKFFAEGAFQVAIPVIFSTIYYFLLGFGGNGAQLFFEFALMIVLTSMAAISHGYMVGALANSVGAAIAIGPLLLMPLVLFGGFFINVNDIDPWFVWISYISFIRYGFEGIMVTIWETQGVVGEAVLNGFNFKPENKWRNVGLLCVLTLGYRLASLLILKLAVVNNKAKKL